MTVTARRNVYEFETYSGQFVDLRDPQPGTITLADIAVGLSTICRFGGQVSRFYSVAEHSVRCAEEAAARGQGYLARPALFHDAHEAYTNDITAPMKHTLNAVAPGALESIQRDLDAAIAAKFDLWMPDFRHPAVKAIDDYVMFREAAGLKYSHGIGEHWGNDEYHEPLVAYGWTPAEAERRFIECYERLTRAAA